MKRIGLSFLLVTLLNADEIERINALVKEVESMRVGYEKCEEQLKIYKTSPKSAAISVKQDECETTLKNIQDGTKKKIESLQTKIKDLESQIVEYKNKLKLKTKEIKSLHKQIDSLKTDILKKEKSLSQQATGKLSKRKCLQLQKPLIIEKEKQSEQLALDSQNRVVVQERYTVRVTKPKTFRTLHEADIYDKPDGAKIDRWVEGRSFTSYIESGDWIKITGYFVDKKWTEAKKELWIRKFDAFER